MVYNGKMIRGAVMTIDGILDEIRELSLSERKKLISLIVDTLTDEGMSSIQESPSLLELEGLGAEIWAGINADEYVRQLRDEWDENS